MSTSDACSCRAKCIDAVGYIRCGRLYSEWRSRGTGSGNCADGAFVVDKSLKDEGAAFVRLQQDFAGDVPSAEITSRRYHGKLATLRLLGIPSAPDTMELCR